jgi:hypothetical protein
MQIAIRWCTCSKGTGRVTSAPKSYTFPLGQLFRHVNIYALTCFSKRGVEAGGFREDAQSLCGVWLGC